MNIDPEKLDDVVLTVMYGKDANGVRKHLDRIEWLEQELARRYLLGAMKYLDETMERTFRHQDVIPSLDARSILVECINLNTPGFEKFLQELSELDTIVDEDLPLVECQAVEEDENPDHYGPIGSWGDSL